MNKFVNLKIKFANLMIKMNCFKNKLMPSRYNKVKIII